MSKLILCTLVIFSLSHAYAGGSKDSSGCAKLFSSKTKDSSKRSIASTNSNLAYIFEQIDEEDSVQQLKYIAGWMSGVSDITSASGRARSIAALAGKLRLRESLTDCQ